MATRPGMVMAGQERAVRGPVLQPGDPAPNFELTARDWSRRRLSDYKGKVKIVSVVPSLDTSVCSEQTRRFEEIADELGGQVAILTVSSDLPYAQKRWGEEMGVEKNELLSSHYDMAFADTYGTHVTEYRINQRAVFVIDQNDVIRHAEYVPVMGNEVNFDAAEAAARALLP